MTRQVDAQTQAAGQVFSGHLFRVPDFQRGYDWRADGEVFDFWRDLSRAVGSDAGYFLGLLILTEENGRMTVVDGQQRIVTVSLLAQALQAEADKQGRVLLSELLRDTILWGIEYDGKSEGRAPRLSLNDSNDRLAFERILRGEEVDAVSLSRIGEAYDRLRESLTLDLSEHGAARLSDWVRFVIEGLQFAVFTHPSRAAAFKVFEVVNARGRGLTPADLIKAYLIGSSSDGDAVASQWMRIDEAFKVAGAGGALTAFIRHAFTLRHGYTLPSDLYDGITEKYVGAQSTSEFLQYLETMVPPYLQLVDPSGGFIDSPVDVSAFSVLGHLGLRTVRPLFMAIQGLPDEGERSLAYTAALRIIVPRIVVGTFGTGSIESRFAVAARKVASGKSWRGELDNLQDLRPPVADFEARVANRSLNKPTLHVLRESAFQKATLPEIEGSLHFIRPRYAQWPTFSEEDFKAVGTTLGNSVILNVERRPQASRTPDAAATRLGAALGAFEEITALDIKEWSASSARDWGTRLARRLAGIWYGDA